MTKIEKASTFSRRSILQAGGAFVVSVGMPIGLDTVLGINAALAQGAKPPLTPDQLSSYVAVNVDGSVSAFFGKASSLRSARWWRKSSTSRSRASRCSWATLPQA
jgi:hypothetical protein